MTRPAIYKAAPTAAALDLIDRLTQRHAGGAVEAARDLLLAKVANDDGTMGVVLEAYCIMTAAIRG